MLTSLNLHPRQDRPGIAARRPQAPALHRHQVAIGIDQVLCAEPCRLEGHAHLDRSTIRMAHHERLHRYRAQSWAPDGPSSRAERRSLLWRSDSRGRHVASKHATDDPAAGCTGSSSTTQNLDWQHCPSGDNPALRENDKPFRLIRALHDFKVHAPQDLLDRTSELRSLVSAIGGERHQKRIAREEHGHQPNAPVAILDMGGVHDRVHQQALRVDEKVTLLAFDPFTRIVARRVDRGPPFSALFTLWLSMIATVGLASREACSRHVT